MAYASGAVFIDAMAGHEAAETTRRVTPGLVRLRR